MLLIPDEWWATGGLLLPAEPPWPEVVRPRNSDRACLIDTIFVLIAGLV